MVEPVRATTKKLEKEAERWGGTKPSEVRGADSDVKLNERRLAAREEEEVEEVEDEGEKNFIEDDEEDIFGRR